MQPGALRALEFDRIVEAVTRFAVTPMGEERLARLAPSVDAREVAHLLAGTTETARYLVKHLLFPLRAAADLPQTLDALAVAGRPLEARRLLALATFLDSVDEARSAIRRAAGSFPQLEAASGAAASFRDEIARTRHAIDPSGDVVDSASPMLRSLRDRLRVQRSRLRSTLESFLRGRDTAKYLQDHVVTERNGRSVLVIKSEHRGSVPGIVHGMSTSGASLYLEPLGTIDINNDIVALEEQEHEEVLRILLALTDAFRVRAEDVQCTVDAAASLDVLQARARYGQAVDGVEPVLTLDGAIELLAARHPLLKSAVPVTIRILPPSTVLLITGPNTGGKTVALKTAGLLALMAQAGLHVPAAHGTRLPVFRSIFADIGDEQSIEANLSTFSGHIANIASMDRLLQTPALVLLDEIGSGTDPVEGGALGVAIVDHFRTRGATVMATSHYDQLKTYASTSAGVTSAAFGFNPDTFAPTYQLLYGSPGRSLALEMAGRLGLGPSIVAFARQSLTDREAQLAEHLATLDRDMRALEHAHQLAAREREALAVSGAKLRQREDALGQREDAARRKLGDEMAAHVRQARRQIDDIVSDLKSRTQAITARHVGASRVTTGDTGMVRSQARAAVDAVARPFIEPADEPLPGATETVSVMTARAPSVGDRVLFGGLGLEATVTALHNDTAELDVRGKRMRASVRDLRVVGAQATGAARVRVNVELGPRDNAPGDLNVIGCTVDEAIGRAERFLDESLLTDQHVVRVIHGHGTGQLKRALSGFLQQHPLVVKFAAAPPEHGGGGVTVVELKD